PLRHDGRKGRFYSCHTRQLTSKPNTLVSVILPPIMNKPSYPHPFIAREGWPFLAGIVLISIIVSLFSGWASIPFWIVSLFVLQFFRDPARLAPDGELNVLSPADGRIVAVEETTDPYHENRNALKISVFMNVFNVHS